VKSGGASHEVWNQINLENAEAHTAPNAYVDTASSGIARMLGDGHRHIFVVSGDQRLQVDRSQQQGSENDGLGTREAHHVGISPQDSPPSMVQVRPPDTL
jgi:hypothetical protein